MKRCDEFLVLKGHGDMYIFDHDKDILVPLDNATEEVRRAIEIINKQMKI